METILQYADPRATQRHWGPFFFFPSIRSIVLVAALVGSFFWLRLRHEPWVVVGTIQTPSAEGSRFDFKVDFTFTPTHHLVVGGKDGKVRLYDPSGRFVRNVSTVPAHYEFLKSGTQLLLLEKHKPEGVIVDVFDGHVIKTIANPLKKEYQIKFTNDDASRVLTSYSLLGTWKWAIWDLSTGEHWSTIKPIFEQSDPIKLPQSPDWTYAILDKYEFDHVVAFDHRILWLKDLKVTPPPASPIAAIYTGYVRDFHVTIAWPRSTNSSDAPLEVRKLDSGKLIFSTLVSMRLSTKTGIPTVYLSASNDGNLLGVHCRPSYGLSTTHVFDLRKGVQIGKPGLDRTGAPQFISGSHQFIQWWIKYRVYCVFDDPAAEPLFLFEGSRTSNENMVAPDGSRIIVRSADALKVLKNPGPEVRLSRLGILNMPHTWLLVVAGLATVLSLILDARRRSAITILPAWLSLPAGFLAAALCLYMLLWLILARREWTPAPLLLFAVVALSLGSKLWRWICTFALAACILWYANLLRLHFQPGYSGPLKLFDTAYNIPRPMPLVILSLGSALSLLLLLAVLLRRPKPGSDQS